MYARKLLNGVCLVTDNEFKNTNIYKNTDKNPLYHKYICVLLK